MMTEAGTPTPTIAWVDGIPDLFNIYLFNNLYCTDRSMFQGPNLGIFTIFQGPSSLQLNNRRHGGSGPSDDILQSLQH
jgi:hypothetical protein